METIKNFEQVLDMLAERGTRSQVAVVWPADEATREAVASALAEGFIHAILIGCGEDCLRDNEIAPYKDHVTVMGAENAIDAAEKAVQLVREGKADILMKGMINTDDLLRPILNKEKGILKPGAVLTHLTCVEIPTYPRLLLFGDAAVIPFPNDEQRHAQVKTMAHIGRAMGIECPRIALVHCSEKVDPRHFPYTDDYMRIKEMAKAGEFGRCIVDGPLDVKVACNKEAMVHKGINSPLRGKADALLFPNIEAANTFYKTLTLFCGGVTAGFLKGADVTVVVPSRGDSVQSKLYSLALAAL